MIDNPYKLMNCYEWIRGKDETASEFTTRIANDIHTFASNVKIEEFYIESSYLAARLFYSEK